VWTAGRPGPNARTSTMGWRVGGSSKGCRTGSAVGLAIWPTRRHAKSPAEEHHEELGEIDARHALPCPLVSVTGGKTFYFH
jgi:hypothetical protein